MLHAELRFMDGFGRCGIDAPVEAEHIGRAVRLQAIGLGRRGKYHRVAAAGKEDQQRDGAVDRAKDGPVRRARALKAGVDDVFRPVRLVGLRNQAAAADQRILDGAGIGERR